MHTSCNPKITTVNNNASGTTFNSPLNAPFTIPNAFPYNILDLAAASGAILTFDNPAHPAAPIAALSP